MLIHEENQVLPFTVAGEVTPDTPLSRLNLNWDEGDLSVHERTRHVHRLHPFLGKYIPQLAEIFLRKYFKAGQTVADPFAGSGTTLVQANELGIHSVGYDISVFNVLLCRAKTARYDLEQMEAEVLEILQRVRDATQTDEGLAVLGKRDEAEDKYLWQWFAPNARRELLTYRHFLNTGNCHYADLLGVILSRSARSARLIPHFEWDAPKHPQVEPYFCFKHSRICQPPTQAYNFLERYSRDAIRRIKAFAPLRSSATVEIHHADSRNVDFPPIDGVITSPPYLGLIDYHQQHTFASHLLGLQDLRTQEIGAASEGKSQKALHAYKEGMTTVFRRAAAAMPSGGHLIVVAADKAGIYPEIAKEVGVETEAVLQRQVNRRVRHHANAFSESVLIWRKP